MRFRFPFQVSRTYLGFCSDPKYFIVQYEQNVVRYVEKLGEIWLKTQYTYKILEINKY